MRAIIGLGNPGPRYAATRHNVGFRIVDELLARHGGAWQGKFKGRWARLQLPAGDVLVLEPETFMNLSGDSVVAFCHFFRLQPEELLVVHDELDLPVGALRLKRDGGHAGHNGLRSIIERSGSRAFGRLRVGIGRPVHGDVADYVLGSFGPAEAPWVDEAVRAAAQVCEDVVREGFATVQQRIHTHAGVPNR